MVVVPRSWPGQTVVCVATGPSLTAEDVASLRGRWPVIVINDAYRLAPWADALYAADVKWWRWHDGVPGFAGAKWSIEHSMWRGKDTLYPDVQRLRNTGPSGLEHDPTGLKNGRNSGFQAINLAVHYGAARIVLLGYDMQPRHGQSHFFGEHPNNQKSPYDQFRRQFGTLVKPLRKVGIEVVNCTRASVLDCFPKRSLDALLAEAPLEVSA